MNLSVGIVGFPNVGKSTLFNALLKKQAALAANYPFATIEPNVGIVPVPDPVLARLAKVVEQAEGGVPPQKPATVEFVDIAGLVQGASKGEGLGNQFLSHIRECSVILHVLRSFQTEDVVRAGATHPTQDYQVIETELQLADLNTLEKQKPPKGGMSTAEKERSEIIERLKTQMNQGKSARQIISPEEAELVQDLHLLTLKPELFVVNVDEQSVAKFAELEQQAASELGVDPQNVVVLSALMESQLAELSEEEQAMFLEEYGVTRSGLERVARAAYHSLGLQSFYTAGIKEVRAWTIRQGATAPEAAGVIHTDFEKKFIRALVVSVDEYVEFGGLKVCKEKGKLRQEGKAYVMQPNDVVEFLIGS